MKKSIYVIETRLGALCLRPGFFHSSAEALTWISNQPNATDYFVTVLVENTSGGLDNAW